MIFKYLLIFECATIAKYQFSLILASFLLLTNYLLINLINEETIKVKKIIKNNHEYLISTKPY